MLARGRDAGTGAKGVAGSLTGNLDVRWIHGSPSAKHDRDPEIQVHRYDDRTVILRQNMSVNYEAPFLFLLLGEERALLVDTGATPEPEFFPLRDTVDGLVEEWLAGHPRDGYRLLVAHSHSHGDHVAGDGQFADRPDTTVVGAGLRAVTDFFGLPDWPDGTGRLDLGGRVLEVIPSPGHDQSAVTWYDRATGLLLTGDTVYPGRLYVVDWPAFTATIDRLLAFAEEHPVSHLLGCHIEMTRQPGIDYPIRTTYQPDEPPLQMTVADLRSIRQAIDQVDDTPGIHPFDHFVLYHGIPDRHFG
jgi:glyoxylase-like metal-dependent hydrolase (beta-lactamase superfamily II)